MNPEEKNSSGASFFHTENQIKDEEVLAISVYKPALFKILVDRYQEAFIRKAQGVISSREGAEDIVQEAFVKIYFNASKFKKYEGIEFKSWAYKILMNTAITKYRKAKKENTVEFLEPILYENLDSGEDLALATDNKNTVSKIISLMPESFQKLLRLYYLEDKSYQTIALKEGITLAALKMKLFRAKKLFRKLFEANMPNPKENK